MDGTTETTTFDFDEKPEAVMQEFGEDDDPVLHEAALAALRTIFDPEIPVNIVELGLVYKLVAKKGGQVAVEMTLTTPNCPVAESMPGEVERTVRGVEGVEDVDVQIVWEPMWHPGLMSEEAKLELGML